MAFRRRRRRRRRQRCARRATLRQRRLRQACLLSPTRGRFSASDHTASSSAAFKLAAIQPCTSSRRCLSSVAVQLWHLHPARCIWVCSTKGDGQQNVWWHGCRTVKRGSWRKRKREATAGSQQGSKGQALQRRLLITGACRNRDRRPCRSLPAARTPCRSCSTVRGGVKGVVGCRAQSAKERQLGYGRQQHLARGSFLVAATFPTPVVHSHAHQLYAHPPLRP